MGGAGYRVTGKQLQRTAHSRRPDLSEALVRQRSADADALSLRCKTADAKHCRGIDLQDVSKQGAFGPVDCSSRPEAGKQDT